MAIHFLARWYPKPERLPEFLGILQRLAGSLPPDVAAGLEQMHTVLNRNGEFLAFEIWKDEQAMNRLRRSKLFHDAIREFSACCSRPLEFEYLDTLDGDGSVFKRYPAGKPDPELYPDLGPMTPIWR
jgi:quinol monooxygenase YgiN